jgi:hypothetical protein
MRTTLILSSIVLICLLSGCSDSDSDNGTAPVNAPDTPTGLDVLETGLTSLTLSWDICDGVTGYKLYRSTSASGSYTEVYSGAAEEFVDGGLGYAATYYYQVSARNSGGESDRCAAVSGTTDTPVGFTVTGSPSGAVDYTFNYLDIFNGKPRYQSDPIGLWIVVPPAGDQAGLWVFYDQIEGINLYYHAGVSDYPPSTGWGSVSGGTRTTILLTPF